MSGSKNDHGSTTESVRPNGRDRQAMEAAGGASIDKVRDILFGGQMREFERRFARLEERLLKETTDLKAHLKSRLDALESFAKKESESLTDQIKAEHEARADSIGTLSRELKDATKTFERRATAADDQQAKSQRELRQQILEQSQRLSDEIRKRTDEMLAALGQEAQQLRTDKADRANLAALLTEMALRLTGDFQLPGGEDSGE
jgi:DNA anti-recombination protein RmuC